MLGRENLNTFLAANAELTEIKDMPMNEEMLNGEAPIYDMTEVVQVSRLSSPQEIRARKRAEKVKTPPSKAVPE